MNERATYQQLLKHPFLLLHGEMNTDISAFVSQVLDSSVEAGPE